jgi:titin
MALANRYEGIYIAGAGSNTIGSELTGGGNLISGNTTRGILITNSSGIQIHGNRIGTKADGASALPNSFFGVELEDHASRNSIGGSLPGAGNRIAFNGGAIYAGVRVRDLATNNAILGNTIFSNAALGIDLSGVGVTGSDACDADTGGNQRQNFPVLIQAYGSGNVGVRGMLNGAPNTTFRLQFFASPACDASGNGEGVVYLGDQLVTTGPTCAADFVVTLPGAVAAGQVITATATDPANNTSEFSACRTVLIPPSLALSPANNGQIALAWTNIAPGFVLKEATNLAPPIVWTTVTNLPTNIGGQFLVTLARKPGNLFYLLNFE